MKSNPRRVLYVDTYRTIGGAQYSLFYMVTNLNPARYRPLVALVPRTPLQGHLAAAGIRSAPIPFNEGNYSMPSLKRPWAILKSVASVTHTVSSIVRLARRENIELIHANSVEAGVHALFAAMWLRLPCVVHARDSISPTVFTIRFLKLLLRYNRSILVFVSRALADYYGARKSSPYRYTTIHNGVDTAIFHLDREAKHRLVSELGLPQDCFLIGAVGLLLRFKGFALLLDAFALVAEQYPQARLLIVGDVPFRHLAGYKQELLDKVHQLGLEDKVVFTGFRDDMPTVMSALDLLVHCPTGFETFGRILIEAMSCSRPIVTVPMGGIPEVVSDGKNALLAPVGDSKAIAAAICRLLADPALAHRLGEAGRQTVEAHFSIQRSVAKVQQLYSSMLQESA